MDPARMRRRQCSARGGGGARRRRSCTAAGDRRRSVPAPAGATRFRMEAQVQAATAKSKLQARLQARKQQQQQRSLQPELAAGGSAGTATTRPSLTVHSPLVEVLGLVLHSPHCDAAIRAALRASCACLRTASPEQLCEATTGFPYYTAARLFKNLPSERGAAPDSERARSLAAGLGADGYVVIDDFVGPELAAAVAAAVIADVGGGSGTGGSSTGGSGTGGGPAGGAEPAGDSEGSSSPPVQRRLNLAWRTPTPYDWRDDQIAWIEPRELQDSAHPAFAALAAKLADLCAALTAVVELGGGKEEPYQLACFAPGQTSRGYIRHIDEDGDGCIARGRRLTVTVYFTARWSGGGHGGELRVWPRGRAGGAESRESKSEPGEAAAGKHDAPRLCPRRAVDLQPVPGRVVVFLSGACWHMVRPWRHPDPAATRVALTAFLH
eukprot:SAG22_NODE_162_length_16848_cov_16.978267_13_plen_438_part_00